MVSKSSFVSEIPLLDAASISWKSIEELLLIDKQESHSLHGSPSTKFSQFNAFVNILANEVFPTPLVPVKRNAWCAESFIKEFNEYLDTLKNISY